ncbi:hypothetical protein SAMN06265350_11059 [Solitalea koreensis]|uniref:Uncharacterized protein n=1 Tax=Solitalea koreensis TaxID=543615 RepID=A0A521E255_9SPHI|nr:hypothetical protein SAMN06265350_11059 [Solitalea koreensis]
MTILLFGGLYIGLRFAFGLFTPYNFWSAGQDIKNGKIQIVEIGEMPLNFEQKQKLANSYGFNFYLFGCNVTTDIINGTEYYNEEMVDHLESKFGAGWWIKFRNQIDSIDKAETEQTETPTKRLSFKNISEIVADNSYSTWVKLQDSSASLALHFQYKDTLAVSYSPECWLMFPYKLDENKIVVYWDNNIDTKYNFDIVKAIKHTDKKFLGQPFMILELENDTTFKATYPMKELIRKNLMLQMMETDLW